MNHFLASKLNVFAPVDAVILAMAQVIQPAGKDEIYRSVKGSRFSADLDEKSFHSHFDTLERAKLFWRTEEKKYVVTAEGDTLARRSMNSKARDKVRLLLLNKKRYIND